MCIRDKYKPVVTAAISEDAAYRNACGHSDRENAVIEGNAAVRRAVLGSKDMELIRLYSDVPEFRQRLHREVIDETYPKLHELLRPLSQEDIDTALCAWNGNIAVSYTHLDVYKRQSMALPSSLPHRIRRKSRSRSWIQIPRLRFWIKTERSLQTKKKSRSPCFVQSRSLM